MRGENKTVVTCLNCGKLFHIKPSALRRAKFCSRKCKGEWMSKHWRGKNNPHYKGGGITLVCQVCGKTFKAWRSEIRRGRKYCSKECYVKAQPRKLELQGLEDTLRELYVEKKLSTIEIGKRLRCDPKTVTYWMDKFGIPRRTLSEIKKANNPFKRPDVRKKMSEKAKLRGQKLEEKKRRSERAKKLWTDPKMRERLRRKISQSLIGNKRRKGKPHSKEVKEQIGKASKRLWKNPEYARKVVTALQEKPNAFERKLIRIIRRNRFPFKYVGDGQVVIDGKVPDFIATDGSKRVIELFGAPWHDPNHSEKIDVEYDRTEEGRKRFFAQHGYECLVIWGYELDDEAGVVERINKFMR